jgi:hypothetical protein
VPARLDGEVKDKREGFSSAAVGSHPVFSM